MYVFIMFFSYRTLLLPNVDCRPISYKNKLPSVEGSPTARELEAEPESESGLIPSDSTTLDKPAYKK